MKRFANRMQERFNQQYQSSKNSSEEEGKITVEKVNNSTKIKSDDLGDYIDFEEVEE